MKPLLLTLILAHGCDAVTTVAGMRAGALELNPVLGQEPARNVMTQVAITSGQAAALLLLLQRRHPKLARTLGIAAIAIEGLAVGNNLHVIRGR